MMRLHGETYDQLLILAHVSQVKNGRVCVAEIAAGLDMSKQKVQKLAHRLVIAGFLDALRRVPRASRPSASGLCPHG